jgi:predicted oxidoreductase
LCEGLTQFGVYGKGALTTLHEFNQAFANGSAAQLRIPRKATANALLKPPFYALGLTTGITFTLGGLQINENAQVIDRSARVIPGLYAAGADSGGVHNEQYAGGLCLGLVFGRKAAHHAIS